MMRSDHVRVSLSMEILWAAGQTRNLFALAVGPHGDGELALDESRPGGGKEHRLEGSIRLLLASETGGVVKDCEEFLSSDSRSRGCGASSPVFGRHLR